MVRTCVYMHFSVHVMYMSVEYKCLLYTLYMYLNVSFQVLFQMESTTVCEYKDIPDHYQCCKLDQRLKKSIAR